MTVRFVQVELDGTLSGQPIDSIIAYGSVVPESGTNIFTEGVPIDYAPETYTYTPAVSGQYDPNGFSRIPDPEQPLNE
jgi:hypothetical protein